MVAKLSRQHQAEPERHPAEPAERIVPKGWGGPAAVPATQHADDGQRARITEQLQARPVQDAQPAETARSAFTGGVSTMRAALEAQQTETAVDAPHTASVNKTPRARKTAEKPALEGYAMAEIRLGVLKVAFSDPETSLEDGLEIAGLLVAWVLEV